MLLFCKDCGAKGKHNECTFDPELPEGNTYCEYCGKHFDAYGIHLHKRCCKDLEKYKMMKVRKEFENEYENKLAEKVGEYKAKIAKLDSGNVLEQLDEAEKKNKKLEAKNKTLETKLRSLAIELAIQKFDGEYTPREFFDFAIKFIQKYKAGDSFNEILEGLSETTRIGCIIFNKDLINPGRIKTVEIFELFEKFKQFVLSV